METSQWQSWPEQDAIDTWWAERSLELKKSATAYRIKVQKRIQELAVDNANLNDDLQAANDRLERYEEVLRKVANEMLTTSLSYKFRDMARDVLGEEVAPK